MKKAMLVIAICFSISAMGQVPKLNSPNWKQGLTELVKSNPSAGQINEYFVKYKVNSSMVLGQLTVIETGVTIGCIVGCIVSYVICTDLCNTPHSCRWCEVDYNNCQKGCDPVVSGQEVQK